MSSKIKFFIKAMLVVGALITIITEGRTINQLQKQIKNQEEYIEISQANMTLALGIISIGKTWYVVNKDSVSSEPSGQGIVIRLDTPLRDQGSRTFIHHVASNAKIQFVTKASPLYGYGYTVCGGILGYVYIAN